MSFSQVSNLFKDIVPIEIPNKKEAGVHESVGTYGDYRKAVRMSLAPLPDLPPGSSPEDISRHSEENIRRNRALRRYDMSVAGSHIPDEQILPFEIGMNNLTARRATSNSGNRRGTMHEEPTSSDTFVGKATKGSETPSHLIDNVEKWSFLQSFSDNIRLKAGNVEIPEQVSKILAAEDLGLHTYDHNIPDEHQPDLIRSNIIADAKRAHQLIGRLKFGRLQKLIDHSFGTERTKRAETQGTTEKATGTLVNDSGVKIDAGSHVGSSIGIAHIMFPEFHKSSSNNSTMEGFSEDEMSSIKEIHDIADSILGLRKTAKELKFGEPGTGKGKKGSEDLYRFFGKEEGVEEFFGRDLSDILRFKNEFNEDVARAGNNPSEEEIREIRKRHFDSINGNQETLFRHRASDIVEELSGQVSDLIAGTKSTNKRSSEFVSGMLEREKRDREEAENAKKTKTTKDSVEPTEEELEYLRSIEEDKKTLAQLELREIDDRRKLEAGSNEIISRENDESNPHSLATRARKLLMGLKRIKGSGLLGKHDKIDELSQSMVKKLQGIFSSSAPGRGSVMSVTGGLGQVPIISEETRRSLVHSILGSGNSLENILGHRTVFTPEGRQFIEKVRELRRKASKAKTKSGASRSALTAEEKAALVAQKEQKRIDLTEAWKAGMSYEDFIKRRTASVSETSEETAGAKE